MELVGRSIGPERYMRKASAMLAFLKSDLFLRFLGGFAIGAVGMFMLQPEDSPVLGSTAIAATSTNAAGNGQAL